MRVPSRFLLCSSVMTLCGVVACTGPSHVASESGEKIFAQKCSNCHGKAGEGVEGKYAEALFGDWALPKLTHYIAQNMPDDDPETLSPTQASAVATYVFDTFYSRAAQARIHPARIELSHLTNQQYAITVAEMLRGLDAETTPTRSTEVRSLALAATGGPSHGLTATYYRAAQRGRFDNSKIAKKTVDAQVEVEMADDSPAYAEIGSMEFSAQWRGSILADETGDYEFVVRTPNSVRVWINADATAGAADAIIDVNVSRPDEPDHRATVRLLGGRSYPIAIDYWALPEKVGASPRPTINLRWRPPHGSERTIPARNLTPMAVPPTYVIATRFPADDSSRGYERGGVVSKAWDEATTSAAFELANYVSKRVDRFAGTFSTDPRRSEKVQALAEKFVTTAFRRPLTAEEKSRYVTARFEGVADPETALKRVVLFALKSPQFLYVELPSAVTEAGSVSGRRTGPLAHARGHDESMASGYAVASRLSFALWDSAPDDELLRVAAAGDLGTRAGVVTQANRMLADPKARAKLREFFHQWLRVVYVEDLRKDEKLFPDFTPEIIDDLRVSLDVFLDSVAWSAASDYRELLRADYLFVNERLAKFYGLPASPSGEFVRESAPAGHRSGVLTHPYLLAAFSYKAASSPIHRGVFLTRNIIGRSLKPPPMAQTFNEAEFTPGMTMREKVVKLTRSENCQGCHAVINPLGFSLEWYDAVGRFRREEAGRPIDAFSEYFTDDNEKVRLAGARDVAEFAIANEQANRRFVEQVFNHLVKQPAMAFGPETLETLRHSFIASGYNLQKLLVEIAALGALRGVDGPVQIATTNRIPQPN